MSLAKQIQGWGIGRGAGAVQAQIDDEMDFHIDSRIDELVDRGLSYSEARARARDEFGDRRIYSRDCRRIQMGIRPWLIGMTVLGLLVAVSVIGWLALSLNNMKSRNQDLVNQLKSTMASLAVPPSDDAATAVNDKDLTGRVVDAEGNGIAGARVLLVHKSWPGGRFAQRVFDTETDEEGNYVFEERYSTRMQNAFLVTILAKGHGMESKYKVFDRGKPVRDQNFRLKPATSIRFEFVDADGEALSDTDIFVQSRKVRATEHMAYYQSSDAASWPTDEAGKLDLEFFQQGDKVKFAVQMDGQWVETEVRIGKEMTQQVVVKKK